MLDIFGDDSVCPSIPSNCSSLIVTVNNLSLNFLYLLSSALVSYSYIFCFCVDLFFTKLDGIFDNRGVAGLLVLTIGELTTLLNAACKLSSYSSSSFWTKLFNNSNT